MDFKSKIILISGPTASGKSSFAIKVAKKINGEIINADSMQIYKQLKILSARPDPKKYQKIEHHLYGFHDAKKSFSTGDWLKLVNKKIKEVQNKNKTPILVGGTGLYFKALTEGLVKIPNIPVKFRNQIRSLHQKLGQKNFYKKLLKLDFSSRLNINPTDSQRSIRAYEVKKFTKKSLNGDKEYDYMVHYEVDGACEWCEANDLREANELGKEEVYRKAFFLPPSKKKLVHDALKQGTKPSLVASQIPDEFDVPFKSFVLASAVAAMALSVAFT